MARATHVTPLQGAVVGVLLIVGTTVLVPPFQGWLWAEHFDGAQRPSFVNEARRTIVQFWGGAVVLLGLYVAWNQLRTADDANRIARDGQRTDRFTRAVEQLGHQQSSVRSGGLFGLEMIAQESAADSWRVAEVLCAYIRERTRKPQPHQVDVQSALTALGRRPFVEQDPPFQRLDLSHCYLSGYSLEAAKLPRVDARGSAFDGSNLNFVDLRDAKLAGASFRGAKLHAAKLRGAYAAKSAWDGAWLKSADCEGTNFKRASMRAANFSLASCAGTRFDVADLRMADFTQAAVSSAVLREASTEGAVFAKTR